METFLTILKIVIVCSVLDAIVYGLALFGEFSIHMKCSHCEDTFSFEGNVSIWSETRALRLAKNWLSNHGAHICT